ncbi:hypothetical protein Q3C01_27220 [Bradyrhizobium sp. UFLA05-109]
MIGLRREAVCLPQYRSTAIGAAFVECAGVRRILVQADCGQIVPLEVPFGMSDGQLRAEVAKGQLIALMCLSAGTVLLFALLFLS